MALCTRLGRPLQVLCRSDGQRPTRCGHQAPWDSKDGEWWDREMGWESVGSVGDVKIWSKLGITRISSLTIVFGSWKLRHRHFPNKDESGLGWVYQQNLNTPMRLVGGLGSHHFSPSETSEKQAMDSCGESWSSCGCDDQALLAHHRRVIEWPSFFGWLKLPLDFQGPSWIILDLISFPAIVGWLESTVLFSTPGMGSMGLGKAAVSASEMWPSCAWPMAYWSLGTLVTWFAGGIAILKRKNHLPSGNLT